MWKICIALWLVTHTSCALFKHMERKPLNELDELTNDILNGTPSQRKHLTVTPTESRKSQHLRSPSKQPVSRKTTINLTSKSPSKRNNNKLPIKKSAKPSTKSQNKKSFTFSKVPTVGNTEHPNKNYFKTTSKLPTGFKKQNEKVNFSPTKPKSPTKNTSKKVVNKLRPAPTAFKFEGTYLHSSVHKRNEIARSVDAKRENTNDEQKGTLIVIDFDKPEDDGGNEKRSDIKDSQSFDKHGYTIILNNNGEDDNESKKEEIYRELKDHFDEMERHFSNYVNPGNSKKLVRVYVITQKNESDVNGVGRDTLPIDPSINNLDNLAELKPQFISLGELTDVAKESQLDLDIDKLKHVKENLKLLNEDEIIDLVNSSKTKNAREQKDSKKDIKSNLSDAEKQIEILDNLSNSKQNDKKDLMEANGKKLQERVNTKHNSDKSAFNEKERLRGKLETEVHRDVKSPDRNHQLKGGMHDDSVDYKNQTRITHEIKYHNEEKIGDIKKKEKLEIQQAEADMKSSEVVNTLIRDLKKNDDIDGRKEVIVGQDESRKAAKEHSLVMHENEKTENIHNHEVKTVSVDESKLKASHAAYNEKDVEIETNKNHKPTHGEEPKDDMTDRKHEIIVGKEERYTNEPTTPIAKGPTRANKKNIYEGNTSEDDMPRMPKTVLPPGNPSPDKSPPDVHMHALPTPTRKMPMSTHKKRTSLKIVVPTAKKFADDFKRSTSNPNRMLMKLPENKVLDKRKAEAIVEFLNKDPLESWRYHFHTLKSLDLNSSILRSGLVNAGNIDRLKGVMRRALEGKDITLTIVGGSISAGGGLYKDRGNIDGLYYKGVVDWWNKMITPLTGSDMLVNNIAIGSIGTDYFSYCIKNHIAMETDIVLWELAANDFNRYKMQPTKGARPLERLTRMALELPNKPALLYVNFFKGVDFKASRESCPNFEDQGEDIIAHYYKIPSLSWRAMVCDGLLRHEPGYNIESLFSLDQYHPSLRGHSQMSLLLLLHLRHVMRAVLQWAIDHNGFIDRFEERYILPEPLFMGPKYPEPLCWTLITADMTEKVTNTLKVKIVKEDGFKLEYATNFPIRYDKVICWKSERPGAEIAIQFYIPQNYGPNGSKRIRSEVAITTHTRWGGSSTIWIDNMRDRQILIKEGRPNDPGKRTQVDAIANDIGPGTHTLNVLSHEGAFCLAAIMVDGS